MFESEQQRKWEENEPEQIAGLRASSLTRGCSERPAPLASPGRTTSAKGGRVCSVHQQKNLQTAVSSFANTHLWCTESEPRRMKKRCTSQRHAFFTRHAATRSLYPHRQLHIDSHVGLNDLNLRSSANQVGSHRIRHNGYNGR